MRHASLPERAWLLMHYDAALRQDAGIRLLAGVDEVGRGALAGPLVAAAVVLPDRYLVPGLDDSKALTRHGRALVAKRVTRVALGWCVAFAAPQEIDDTGLQSANLAAMRSAVEGLPIEPELVLSDAYRLPLYQRPNRAVVHGDQLSQSIAAASCLAKVVRDQWMQVLGEESCLGYGWERNAGYATLEHRRAIAAMGPTPWHRRLFLEGKREVSGQVALPFAE